MDTGLCDHSSVEGCWADHPNGAVAALPIVVQFNVFEDLPLYRIPGPEALTVDSLDFETVKLGSQNNRSTLDSTVEAGGSASVPSLLYRPK